MANGETEPTISRRAFLAGALALTLAPFAGETHSLKNVESMTKIPSVPVTKYNILPLKAMDTAYIPSLLQYLAAESHDKAAKLKSAKNSLRLIQNYRDNTPATAFQIDESGYYITAAHAVPSSLGNQAITITNPYNGEVSKVNSLIVGRKIDLAIVYAPNLNQPSPVEGIQLDFTSLEDGQELWMLALYESDSYIFRRVSSGVVDESASLTAHPNFKEESRVAVRGMIPYGGTSGGLVINSQGSIVGVVSGAYPALYSNPNTYDGAVITPIEHVQMLRYG